MVLALAYSLYVLLLPSAAYDLFLNGNFIIQILVTQLISAQSLLFPTLSSPLFLLFTSTALDFVGTVPCAPRSARFVDFFPQ